MDKNHQSLKNAERHSDFFAEIKRIIELFTPPEKQNMDINSEFISETKQDNPSIGEEVIECDWRLINNDC